MMLMNDKRTNESPLLFIKDSLIGENVKRSLKTLADLRGVFHNCEAYEQMSPDTLLYEVTCHLLIEEGTPGDSISESREFIQVRLVMSIS